MVRARALPVPAERHGPQPSGGGARQGAPACRESGHHPELANGPRRGCHARLMVGVTGVGDDREGEGRAEPHVTDHVSFCRICNAMCGIVVTVERTADGERVERVRGDDAHPLSRGYTCPKGRALGALHHDPRRLDAPVVGRGDDRRPHFVARGARRAHRPPEARPSRQAGPTASPCTWPAGRPSTPPDAGQPNASSTSSARPRSTPPPPSTRRASRSSPSSSAAGRGSRRCGTTSAPGLLVLFGCNPVVSHGHSNAVPDPVARLREHRAAGGQVWVVDPRRTETVAHADRHLQIRPGSDWLVLGWLVQRLLADPGPPRRCGRRSSGLDALAEVLDDPETGITDELVARGTGLGLDELTELLDAVVAAGRVSALTGTGTSMSATANTTEHLLWALHVVTDSYDRPGGMWFNPGYLSRLDTREWQASDGVPEPGPPSRPELPRRFGEWPCAGLVGEIEAGHVTTLIVVGGNPVTAFPDVERTTRALSSLDTLVVVDVMPTETTDVATHVLPAVDQLERADTTWLLDTYQLAVAAQATTAVVDPVAERRPVWWMLGALAERLGLSALPRGATVADATEDDLLGPLYDRSVGGRADLVERPSGTVASGAVFGWVHERVLPDGGWRLGAPPLIEQLRGHLSAAHADRSARRAGPRTGPDPPSTAADDELPATRHRRPGSPDRWGRRAGAPLGGARPRRGRYCGHGHLGARVGHRTAEGGRSAPPLRRRSDPWLGQHQRESPHQLGERRRPTHRDGPPIGHPRDRPCRGPPGGPT